VSSTLEPELGQHVGRQRELADERELIGAAVDEGIPAGHRARTPGRPESSLEFDRISQRSPLTASIRSPSAVDVPSAWRTRIWPPRIAIG
jgi:hypothetical protein